jgi:hypothetical protein
VIDRFCFAALISAWLRFIAVMALKILDFLMAMIWEGWGELLSGDKD